MRAALVMFRDVLPRRAAATLERELAALGRKVGAVRDLDVLATAVARQARKIDAALEPAAASLMRHVREHRVTAHAVLASTLDAPPVRRLTARLDALGARPQASPALGRVAADLVRPFVRAFARAARKALDSGQALLILTVDETEAFRVRELLEEDTRSEWTVAAPPHLSARTKR